MNRLYNMKNTNKLLFCQIPFSLLFARIFPCQSSSLYSIYIHIISLYSTKFGISCSMFISNRFISYQSFEGYSYKIQGLLNLKNYWAFEDLLQPYYTVWGVIIVHQMRNYQTTRPVRSSSLVAQFSQLYIRTYRNFYGIQVFAVLWSSCPWKLIHP